MKNASKNETLAITEQLNFFNDLLNFVYDLKRMVDGYEKKRMSMKHLRNIISNAVVKHRYVMKSSTEYADDLKKVSIEYMQRSARALGYDGLKDSRIGADEFSAIIADVKRAVRLDRDLVLYTKLQDEGEIHFE